MIGGEWRWDPHPDELINTLRSAYAVKNFLYSLRRHESPGLTAFRRIRVTCSMTAPGPNFDL